MRARTVLGILGGIAAAVALGVALSMTIPGLLAGDDNPNALSNIFSGNNNATANSALANERSAPVFYPVTMPIAQADFDDRSTRIPVQVEGTTSSGEGYSKLHFVDGAGFGIKLVAGEYRMTIPAGYISGEGKYYTAPGDEVRAKIPLDLEQGSTVQATIYIPHEQRNDNYVSDEIREQVEALTPKEIEMLVFSEVPLMDITEEQLDEVVSIAKQDTADDGRADEAREHVLKMQEDTRKAQEEAEREAKKAEEIRLAEEQAAAARAEGQAAIDAAKRQAEAEAKAKQEADEEAAKQVAKNIEGWWTEGNDAGVVYRFVSGKYEMYDAATVTLLSKGNMTVTRLTETESEKVGSGGYLISFGGAQCYVLLDGLPGVLECRNSADLSKAATGDLAPTVEPVPSSSSSSSEPPAEQAQEPVQQEPAADNGAVSADTAANAESPASSAVAPAA